MSLSIIDSDELTVNAEYFRATIFRGLNFRVAKFSWVNAPAKINLTTSKFFQRTRATAHGSVDYREDLLCTWIQCLVTLEGYRR